MAPSFEPSMSTLRALFGFAIGSVPKGVPHPGAIHADHHADLDRRNPMPP